MVTVPHVGNPALQKKRKQIIAALVANPDAIEVARQIGGVSSRTVGRIARAESIELRSGKPSEGVRGSRLTPDRRRQIIELLRANPNAAQVARQIGNVGYLTVRGIAKAEGIQLTIGKPLGWQAKLLLSPEHATAVTQALKADRNAVRITAQQKGVSPTTVYRFAKAQGIDLIRPSRVQRKKEKASSKTRGARLQLKR